MKSFNRKLVYFILALILSLFFFEICHYVFEQRVGPLSHISRFFRSNSDNILEKLVYRDLVEEYDILNLQYSEQEVIVFVGDSITKRFNLCEMFKMKKILNRGIFYDTSFGVLNRLDSTVNNLNIKMLFVMIGYNDLKYRNDKEILENISKIMENVKAETIYFQSLLPVDAQRKDVNSRIVLLNGKIRALAKENGFFYVDLHKDFVDSSGGISPAYSLDGTHPNVHGYILWHSIIAGIIQGENYNLEVSR